MTEIDKSLRYKAVNSIVSFKQITSNHQVSRECRLLEIERLKFLEKLGLAKKIGKKSWKLGDHLESTLREMQLSHDIIKSRARHNVQTLTHEVPAPTQIQECQPLTGKVVGMGLEEELHDRRYLLLEGIDGKVHYIQATHSIVKARDQFEFKNGHVITLEKKKFTSADYKTIEHIRVQNLNTLEDLQRMPSSRLDHDVIEYVKAHGIEPKLHFPNQSFAHEYANAMTQRFHELVKEKVILQKQNHHRLAPDWRKQLTRVIKEREQSLKLQHARNLEGHLIGKNKSHHLKHSR